MRIAALYDIHGNLPALDAVLHDVRAARVDRIVVGGDVVPGPMPRDTLSRLRQLDIPVQYIRGNGDREVVARMRGVETGTVPEQFRAVVQWNADQLLGEFEQMLDSWPLTVRANVPGVGDVLFCHATPRSDTEIFTKLTREERLAPVLQGVGASVLVCGHTHMQFDRMVGPLRVVNAGSVGMPFGTPGAYWLLLGPDVELRRTEYDLAAAANDIRRTDYPLADDFASRNVVNPPSEADMLQAFGRAELR
jgi:putative phosphoesterase